MRLFFPGGEHAEIDLDPDETRLGSGAGMTVSLSTHGLASHQASLYRKPHGVWLHVLSPQPACHLNGRPVRELALVRAGDLLCLGSLRVIVRSHAPPPPAVTPRPPGADDAQASTGEPDLDGSGLRYVLRGMAGACSGQSIPVAGTISLGAGSRADIRLDDPFLPAIAMRIVRNGDSMQMWLEHSGSEIELNGWPVDSALLREGDQLACGSHRYLVEKPHPAESAPESEAERPTGVRPGRASRGMGAGTVLLLAAALIALIITAILI